MIGEPPATWTVVIPVKHLSTAKSRMAQARGLGLEALAMAFFQDTASAALKCAEVGRVVVATSDERVTDWARAAGCVPFDDTEHPGINPAVAAAVAADDGPVAVLVSDLPCATPEAISAALTLAARHPLSFVADAAGTGTTMWARARGVVDQSRFGVDSRMAHLEQGAIDLVDEAASLPEVIPEEALARMRRDVDTPDDLRDALGLGVGSHTAAASTQILTD